MSRSGYRFNPYNVENQFTGYYGGGYQPYPPFQPYPPSPYWYNSPPWWYNTPPYWYYTPPYRNNLFPR